MKRKRPVKRLVPIIAAIVVLFALAMVVVSQQPRERSGENESKPYRRWEWAYEQRAYPRKEIPDDVLDRAWRRLRSWRELPQKKGSFRALGLQPSPGRWVNIGPAPILDGQLADANQKRPVSGRISDIAVDPTNPNRWLAGAAQGGVWETRDAGVTWTALTDDQESLSIGALAFDPGNPQIIYAGTGEAVFGGSSPYAGVGLLKSVDGGGTWQILAQDKFKGLSFSDIRVDPKKPADPNKPPPMLAAVTKIANQTGETSPAAPPAGVFKSMDGGASWVSTLGLNNYATDLEPDPGDFSRQYAALGRSFGDANNGVYRSINAGDTWDLIDGPWRVKVGGVGRIELAIAPSNPNVVYVSVQDADTNPNVGNDNQLLGIWKTENAWASPPVWVELTPLGSMATEAQWYYDHELIVDPNNPNILYVGGVHLWKCSDTAARPPLWEQLDNKPDNALHVDQQTMAWTPPSVSTALNHRSMRFEVNQGQTDQQVKFLSRGQGYNLFLTANEAVLQLEKPNRSSRRPRSAVVRMRMIGANKAPRVAGLNQLPGKSHYFIGNDPRQWRTGIPNYEKVRYDNVWPGIDLAYYGKERQLEYDLIVAPGASPKRIKLGFSGARQMSLSRKGDLVLRTGGGRVRLLKPYIYQQINGVKKEVRGRYVRRGKHLVGFRVGAYDRRVPLVIDPVLVYSTYLGGTDFDLAYAVAVDSAGNAYMTGETRSVGFPRSNSIGPISPANGDIFVVKLDPTGSRAIYSTVIGGSAGDIGRGIAVDAAGNAYLTGSTISTNFPVSNAYQSVKRTEADAFVAKLNPEGSALTYCSYLGGDNLDEAFDIAVNSQGQAWITGRTFSTNFPTQSPIQTYPGGPVHVFVAKFGANGNSLLFSTYLGGRGGELANSIALDLAGNTYITGSTSSNDFRTTAGAYQTTFGGGLNDAFVACISAAHTLTWSTYLGGSGNETGAGIAVDAAGSPYLIGSTGSANFPRQNPLQPIYGGNNDAFMTKLSPNGRDLVYSTFYGAGGNDGGREIAVDSSGNALVAGTTNSDNLAQVPNPSPVQPGGYAGGGDAFIAQINAAGSATLFFTYLGGSKEDIARGIALDATGRNVYVAGETSSTNFPTTRGALKETFSGTLGTDAFASKIEVSPSPAARRLIVGNDGGVWSTTNGGQAWADHNTNLAITQFYLGSLHPTDENKALGGSQDNGTELWTTTNQWRRVLGADGTANAFSSAGPDSFWMMSFQNLNIYRTTEGGVTSTYVSGPVRGDATLPFVGRCEKCPSDNNVFLAGTDRLWHTGNFFNSSPGLPTWTAKTPSIGAAISAVAFAPSDNNCATYAYGDRNGRLRLTSNGSTTPPTDIDPANRVPNRWVTDLAFNPIDPNILYLTLSGFDEATAGQPGHVFRTSNALAANPTWVNVSPPINIPHNTVAVDPANPQIVYVGTDMGVWKSADEGVTWEHFGPDRGMPNITVNDIQINEDTGRIVAFTHGRGAFAFERSRADLALTMTDTPDPVVFNQNLTYRLTVRNNGPDRATRVFVLDTLPNGVTFVSATASQGACTSGAVNISCYLGALANGASATVTIVVRSPNPGTITNLAKVSSDEVDPNGANDSASAATGVVASDLSVTKTHTPVTVFPGQNIDYSVVIRNAGMVDATGVVVTDTLPPGVSFVSASATQGSCTRANNTITCNLNNLARSAMATVTIVVRAEASGLIANTVSVGGNEPDSNPANNNATDTLTIGSNPTIAMITPSSAARGATNLELKIEGAFFAPGALISFSPSAGIEVLAVPPTDPGFISGAEIRRRINVQTNAPLGDRQMFVTNPNGSAGGAPPFNRFTITDAGVTAPQIEITPGTLNFGDLALGVVKGLVLTCRNAGTAPLAVYHLRSSNPHFSLSSPGAPFNLDPGRSMNLTVSFTPTAAGAQTGEMIFSSNANGKTTIRIPLRGNTPGGAAACNFTISPDDLSLPQSGGQGSISVTTQPNCGWMVESPLSWVTFNSFPFITGSGTALLTTASSAGPRTGMVAIAGRALTIRQAEQVASVSAASFTRAALASETITAAFGQNLAAGTFFGDSIPLPTNLGGTTVKVRDSAGTERLAPLFFVSSGQINYQVPEGTTTGEAVVTVTSGHGQVSMGTVQIAAVAPSLFTANADGLGVAAAVALRVKADGTQVFEEVARYDSAQRRFVFAPIDPGPVTDQLFLILFATGFRNRSALENVTAQIGGLGVQTLYAGEQGGFVGLDQINLPLPRSLAGRGELEIELIVDGWGANIVKIFFK